MIFEIINTTNSANHKMTSVLQEALSFSPRSKTKYPNCSETFSLPMEVPTKPKRTASASSIKNVNQSNISRGASFVTGQKLRESKWFRHDEMKVFCAVVESGFIVERENEDGENLFGVVLWKPGFEKSKNSDYIEIYTLVEIKGRTKVAPLKLLEFWPSDSRLRINNKNDKDNPAHKEDVIRNQIEYASHFKQKWHNSQHFTYWCRYETPKVHYRMKQISDSVKWANIGISTGLLLLKKRKHSKSETCQQ